MGHFLSAFTAKTAIRVSNHLNSPVPFFKCVYRENDHPKIFLNTLYQGGHRENDHPNPSSTRNFWSHTRQQTSRMIV